MASEGVLAEPFAAALRRAGIQTEVAPAAAIARERQAAAGFVLAVVDAALADGEGPALCRAWHGRQRPVVVAMVSREQVEQGDLPPADEQIVKPFGFEQVASRIHELVAALRAQATEPPSVVHTGELAVDLRARTATLADAPLGLRPKELQLLLRLARDAGQVVTRGDLMVDVWRERRSPSTHTLDVHVRRLRAKLGDVPEAPRYVHTVRGVGFRLGD